MNKSMSAAKHTPGRERFLLTVYDFHIGSVAKSAKEARRLAIGWARDDFPDRKPFVHFQRRRNTLAGKPLPAGTPYAHIIRAIVRSRIPAIAKATGEA